MENSKYAKYLGARGLLKRELMSDLADKDSTSVSDVLAPPE